MNEPRKIDENKFIMFHNHKMIEGQPNYIGRINVNGVIYQIVAWIKRDKRNKQYLAGSINPVDEMNEELHDG